MKYQLHRCTAPCIAAVTQEAYREQAKEARLFLEGRRDELKARLEAAMWQAAEHSAFEQAAQVPGHPRPAGRLVQPPEGGHGGPGGHRLFGSAVLDGRACVHRLVMREGRMVGRREYVIEDVEAFDGAVLAEVLKRVYAEEAVPARILVELEPEDLSCSGSGWARCAAPSPTSRCPSGARRWSSWPWPRRTRAWPWSASSSPPG